ncbi:MAG TPA: ABC transporter ATP-binding protein, partial [Humibacter sp.]|nr:ABC transporter ATP-binding protein [Humibacter sp.]
IVLGRGRVLADAPVSEVIAGATRRVVRVRTPDVRSLTAALAGPDVTVTSFDDGALEVSGLNAAQIGDAAAARGVALHELTPIDASLEEAYLELTQDEVEYHSEVTR